MPCFVSFKLEKTFIEEGEKTFEKVALLIFKVYSDNKQQLH